jgi:hypothetical protein
MSFIDWSDPDEMLGLLAEYVADESLAEREDPVRTRFLDELSSSLTTLVSSSEERSVQRRIERLRDLRASQPAELGSDPVLVHLDDCIQELERIVAQQSATRH